MYGGYYGGWEPSEYITEDIPLTVYESKAGKPYMDIKGWAENKEADLLLRNIYMSAKMMKYHPLMTKELRKTYGLMASAALRAMSPEFKYGVKKQFNKMSTALKAMRAKMKAEKDLYGPYKRRGFFGKIDYWNKLIGLDIYDENVPEYLAGYDPEVITHNADYKYSGPIGTTADYPVYKKALEDRREMNRQKMLMLQDNEKKWYKQRARLWSKGRKVARENIKALKNQFEASDNPIELAAFDPGDTMNDIYKGAFTTVLNGDPDYYNDVTVDDMMTELGKTTHVPWFQQAYEKYVEGQRFADQIPGTRTYSGLTLGSRHQPTKLSDLQRADVHDQSRFLTKKQREQGYDRPPVMYIPADEEDYYMRTGTLPKTLAANAAHADLTGICVPIRQDDGSYKDLQVM